MCGVREKIFSTRHLILLTFLSFACLVFILGFSNGRKMVMTTGKPLKAIYNNNSGVTSSRSTYKQYLEIQLHIYEQVALTIHSFASNSKENLYNDNSGLIGNEAIRAKSADLNLAIKA